MYLLTLIARTATSHEDLLAELEKLEPSISFIQTYQDELQGAFETAESAVRATLLAARNNGYWVGLGVGPLKMPRFAAAIGALSTTDCSGDALDYSRLAVEQAQTGSPARGSVILASDRVFSEQATGLARLLYRISAERSETENKVLALMLPGVRGQQKAVASSLGISAQAVSKTLVRSLYHEQEAAIPALTEILIHLDSAQS